MNACKLGTFSNSEAPKGVGMEKSVRCGAALLMYPDCHFLVSKLKLKTFRIMKYKIIFSPESNCAGS